MPLGGSAEAFGFSWWQRSWRMDSTGSIRPWLAPRRHDGGGRQIEGARGRAAGRGGAVVSRGEVGAARVGTGVGEERGG